MKKAIKLFGLSALIMAFALLISCPSPGSGSGAGAGIDTGTGDDGSKAGNAFTAYDEAGNKYTLTFNNGRSARAAGNDNNQGDDNSQGKKGDNYKITVTGSDGNNKGSNTGKVSNVEGDGILALQDASGNFTVETTKDMDILRFPKGIALDSKRFHEVNGHLSSNRQKVEIKEVTVSGSSLAEKLEWIKKNAQSNTRYTVIVDKDEALDGLDTYTYNNHYSPNSINYLEYPGKRNITVLLKGSYTVSLSSKGILFIIWSGITLELENITLQGRSDNDAYGSYGSAPVIIIRGGALTMQGNSKITGNSGGGVTMNYGTFNMKGNSEVCGNKDACTVGVWGVFTMQDYAKVHNNNSSSSSGIIKVSGTFTMKDNSEICNNTSSSLVSGYVPSFTVSVMDGTMQDNAKIYNNTNDGYGGGLRVYGTFTMNGGEIYSNKAIYGGGVSTGGYRTFTMNGGRIYNNTATVGGGVYLSDGSFNMNGGEIYGNTAGGGGGVYVTTFSSEDFFRITNGTIYGINEANTTLRNTANGSNGGAALYNYVPSGYEPMKVQYGKGSNWTDLPLTPAGFNGSSLETNNTIKVVNGILLQP